MILTFERRVKFVLKVPSLGWNRSEFKLYMPGAEGTRHLKLC